MQWQGVVERDRFAQGHPGSLTVGVGPEIEKGENAGGDETPFLIALTELDDCDSQESPDDHRRVVFGGERLEGCERIHPLIQATGLISAMDGLVVR